MIRLPRNVSLVLFVTIFLSEATHNAAAVIPRDLAHQYAIYFKGEFLKCNYKLDERNDIIVAPTYRMYQRLKDERKALFLVIFEIKDSMITTNWRLFFAMI